MSLASWQNEFDRRGLAYNKVNVICIILPGLGNPVIGMIEKSDAMKTQEKWTEELLKNRPKHKKEGLPIQPWHVLLGLGAIFALVLVISSLIHR
ncbi:MAG: hypothetical protein ACE14P_10020 [Methanotrichaceae archaeon]